MAAEMTLNQALKKLHDLQREWHKGSASRQKQREIAIQNGDEKTLANLHKEEGFTETNRLKIARDLIPARELYVKGVASLRKEIDEALPKIVELKKTRPDLVIHPIPPATYTYLARAETTIVKEEISLEPDKSVFWVEAIINGNPPVKLVIDPAVNEIRMSEHFATAAGIKVDPIGVKEQVAMEDGHMLPARRMLLDSVQVGAAGAECVPCLVILDGFEGPPRLGSNFLDRFTYQLDPDAGNLILSLVDMTRAKNKPAEKPDPKKAVVKKAGR